MAPIQTEEQINKAESAAKELGLGSVAQAKETLSSQTLNEQKDFNIQEGATATAGAGLEGAVEAETDAFTEDLERQRKEAEKPVETARTDIQNQLAQLRGETGLRIEAEEEAGLPEVNKELLDINQQIKTEQHALRREMEAIEKNTAGRSAQAIQDIKSEKTRESLRKQADLSVIQMGIQGRYDSAKAIADRAVNAQMEQQEIILETAMFNYNENKELFTKAEQREFDALAQNRQNEIDEEKSKLQAVSDLSIEALKAGAPTAIATAMRNAEDVTEALSIGGEYLRPKVSPALRKTQVIEQGGRKILIDTQTGEVIKEFTGAEADVEIEELQKIESIDAIDTIDSLKTHKGLNSSVGPIAGTRTALADVFGAKDEFVGSVEQLVSGMTLQSLIDAKAQGATFGALSNAELRLLAQSASKINKWAKTSDGKAVGEGDATSYYDISEKAFKEELDEISFYRKQDAILKGAQPEELSNVQITPDGKIWAVNSDGSLSELRTK